MVHQACPRIFEPIFFLPNEIHNSQPSIRGPWLLGRVFERMTLSHQNVWILGNIYTVFQFRVPSNNHNKIEIYFAKSIFCQNDIGNFLLPDGIFDLEKPYLTSLWVIIYDSKFVIFYESYCMRLLQNLKFVLNVGVGTVYELFIVYKVDFWLVVGYIV